MPVGLSATGSYALRFDDSLETVLAAEMAGPAGTRSSWRQLVDLIGRGRGGASAAAIARLRAIRDDVPIAVRAASARGLERAEPPAALVALFADDATEVAAPVVRSARLEAEAWVEMLPAMRPATRGVLRHRRDLDAAVARALESFGPSDFALPAADLVEAEQTEALVEPVVAAPIPAADASRYEGAGPALRSAQDLQEDVMPPVFVAPEPNPFVPLAEVAQSLPVVAAAREQARRSEPAPADGPGEDFAIAALVARIERHQRDGSERAVLAPLPSTPTPLAFRFETDAAGLIRWCDHASRGALIGCDLAGPINDGAVRGAFARRTAIRDARLEVPGDGEAAGAWRISATPTFERASGRFTGYRGTARRPRRDEAPELTTMTVAPADDTTSDSLRQLVHELRTPTNAISGFAEMIEHQLLGPVPPAYRDQAAAIRQQTNGLLDVIDDLDTAARIETHRLELRPTAVLLVPLLKGVLGDLQALADLRGTYITLDLSDGIAVRADARQLERLFARYLTALISTATRGEVLTGAIVAEGDMVRFDLSRPKGFAAPDGGLFAGDAEVEQTAEGGPLLGTGFAFRLARGLASELGGSLVIGTERLTLRLPAGEHRAMGQASS